MTRSQGRALVFILGALVVSMACFVLLVGPFLVGVAMGIAAGRPDGQTARAREVAAGKPTLASGFYQGGSGYSFPPSAVVDRRTDEQHCSIGVEDGNTYWLLADQRTGWVEVDLLERMAVVKVRWLNTHNGDCADRATRAYHVVLSPTGAFAGEETIIARGEVEFTTDPAFQEVVLPQPVEARYVRFYVDGYYGWGGGLNELQVYAHPATGSR